MVVSNHNLLEFRAISLLVSAFFAVVVYMDVSGIFMFSLFFLQLATFALAFLLKRKRKQKSLVEINLSASIVLVVVYICAIALGVFASMNASRTMEAVCSLLIYVVCLDALMAIPFVLSFTDKTKWQSAGPATGLAQGAAMYAGNGQIAAAYADSDYNAADYDWPQSDYHTTSALDNSPSVNPASGLPMANDSIDVGGNVYGFGDPVFSNDSFHTNQFSDFDYHNNQ